MGKITEILSPVTGSKGCRFIRSYATEPLMDAYRNDLKIETREYFQGNTEINLYECLDSGLRFFVPSGIEGDSKFYAALEKFDWYYLPWKWEHEATIGLLPSTGKLLEIGCAEGHFLEAAARKGMQTEGIELNVEAAEIARSKGLQVKVQWLSEFAAEHPETYDWVCSYQVLEHISDVKGFLTDALACLKPGGSLAISVPNLDTFLRYDDGGILNFPPHHQGWWTPAVLKSLENFFPVELTFLGKENLQKEHYVWFHRNMIRKWYAKGKLFGSLYYRTMKLPGVKDFVLKNIAGSVDGHTMVAVFRKKHN